jgi:hypothetical protein
MIKVSIQVNDNPPMEMARIEDSTPRKQIEALARVHFKLAISAYKRSRKMAR